ncbi:efflux RND transporter permease subunit [Pseudaeromonas paramecii]|uniref:Efflux RND transporter permease subunit n=1 Tax=Pseudaeromonas paramecii TaxID=2138166 RepID=A0ABP8Q9Z8_9GAMM
MPHEPQVTEAGLGIAGRLARQFLQSPITPLICLVALLLGLGAVLITPKEEEPQIEVTFADVFIPFPGASPQEVADLVTLPAEQVISELKDLDTLYSFSQPGGAVLIVVFKVGTPRQQALVELYNQLMSHQDWLPQGLGVGQPLVKPRSIDDVPILGLTLWSQDTHLTAQDLTAVAHGLETELKRLPGTKDIKTVGRHALTVQVQLDPQAMAAYGVSWPQVSATLGAANRASTPLDLTQDNRQIKVQVGGFLHSLDEVRQLVVAVQDQAPVYLGDIAQVTLQADEPGANVWMSKNGALYPAVTLSIAKQPGVNAVDLSAAIQERVATLRNQLIPAQVQVSLTRDYGKTANDKANKLIGKLIFATLAVVLLVWLSMGWREAIVVGSAILLTLALTLFASWVWGFTLNRISLFALIFSIGILVDDAIVVVESIHRHLGGPRPLTQAIPLAVDEVGGPTILATLTVIAALLPMAFVSGLMGPYMSPIPINASTGMLLSLGVAFIVTPYLALHLLGHHAPPPHDPDGSPLMHKLLGRFVQGPKAPHARRWLGLGVMLLLAASLALPVLEWVVLKMLPFDNKSEFQVMVELPEGSPVEQTQALLAQLADEVSQEPEVTDVQLYAGTSAPMNFNGLVRHYFLRQDANLGDLQVNLLDKHHRDRSSHEIALAVRPKLQALAQAHNARLQVVEIPPGPPVWSPILLEVYGPTQALREQAASQIEQIFATSRDVVDIGRALPVPQPQWQLHIDRAKAARLGISQQAMVQTLSGALAGEDAAYLHRAGQKYPVPIRLRLPAGDRVDLQGVLSLTLPSASGQPVPLGELVTLSQGNQPHTLVHKNMQPMIMVTADMAGPLDSPLYGMAEIASQLQDQHPEWPQSLVGSPKGVDGVALHWDGEWKITYETFRDMGIAYGVGILLIYLLVVAQFNSYLVPLIIMAPIPLTIIGVLPGHALLGAQFTATSMIGMIALAGIIVRNSILLVDYANHLHARGLPLDEAVVKSGAVRAKPIILTALAAMIGALFILDDPIFNGLAISLLFGILISTLLTLVVIPVLYFLYLRRKEASQPPAELPAA